MKRIYLSYPNVLLSDSKSLRNYIMYSDAVSTLMPYVKGMKDPRVTKTMKVLNDYGLYEPHVINLQQTTFDYAGFYEDFEPIVDNIFQRIDVKNRVNRLKDVGIGCLDEIGLEDVIKMNTGRLGIIAHSKFSNLGVIRYREKHNSDTIYVDREIGMIYLSALTSYIASNTIGNYIQPITTQEQVFNVITEKGISSKECLSLVLSNVLPTPSMNTSLDKIIDFRIKYNDELLKFRTVIDELMGNLSKCQSSEELNYNLVRFKEAIEIERKKVVDLEKTNLVKFTFNSLKTILDISNPKFLAALGTTGVLSTTVNPYLGLGAGVLSAMGVITSDYITRQEKIDSSKYSYLFKAESNQILNI